MKKALSILLAAVSLFFIASCGADKEKSLFDFNYEMTQKDVAALREGAEKSDVENDNMKSYIRNDIDFFKGEEVAVTYTFDEKTGKLIRTKYDVSNCSEKNIKKLVKYFNKNYTAAGTAETPLGEYTETKKTWKKDGVEITYLRVAGGKNVKQTAFYFKEVGDTDNAD